MPLQEQAIRLASSQAGMRSVQLIRNTQHGKTPTAVVSHHREPIWQGVVPILHLVEEAVPFRQRHEVAV